MRQCWKRFAIGQLLLTFDDVSPEGMFDLLTEAEAGELPEVFRRHGIVVWAPFENWSYVEIANHVERVARLADETAADSSTQPSVRVKHYGAYGLEETVLTHQCDIEDYRVDSGQARVTLGQIEGWVDDLLSVLVEVATDPTTGIYQVPCAQVGHPESPELSVFKLGDRIILRPDAGLQIHPIPGGLYSIEPVTR